MNWEKAEELWGVSSKALGIGTVMAGKILQLPNPGKIFRIHYLT